MLSGHTSEVVLKKKKKNTLKQKLTLQLPSLWKKYALPSLTPRALSLKQSAYIQKNKTMFKHCIKMQDFQSTFYFIQFSKFC